ncbi:glycoside hydrolase family 3 protein [Clostridium aminobutyricum]|uniref:beta-N-acetylhexosaminidase n=1 Tax=Clostridium aminobutyricum TaxID=33953 RepID=A0A939IJR1_CLOAM|nr:glycoside hydrolase family 3 protein [Clostridium aminobutyricum]MBN7773834.1 glycoside hydrolase family 3 protein [Clostridium aminobutyricum]
MKKIFLNALMLVILLILTSCGVPDAEKPDSINNTPPSKPLSKAEQLIKSMTLEEKIGQLFIIRPESLELNLTTEQISNAKAYGATELDSQMIESLKRYPIGGVVIFQKNILSPAQLTDFIDEIQEQSKIPVFVGIDEEGGSVSRIANSKEFDVTKYESMETIGLTEDSKNAQNVGITIGSYLKQYGFNLNFAPVADVNTNPDNIVIGNRSFGSDPALVAKMVSAEIDGLHETGVMSCIKHFPGHGDTKGDTHKGFVSTEKTWEELKECELIPFMNAFKQTDMVMISHITAPNITSDGLPSSLSNEMIEGKLRTELNYDGVVITDSMAMGAITQEYTSSTAAIKSILGGADIILMPENFVEAYDGIYDAVKNGTISEKRIDESVLRILSLKEKYDLLQ